MMKSPSAKIYLMELIIVVVGITIAFQVNVWYEARKSSELEKNAILNLQKELKINLDEFESLKSYRTDITEASRSLATLLSNNTLTIDEFAPLFFRILRTSTPDLQSNASAFYVNSNYGNAHLDLKSELLVLDTYLQELMEMSDGYSDHKELFFYSDEVFASVDFRKRRVLNLSHFKTPQFKNAIWLIGSSEMELNRLYEQAESQLNKVYSMTEKIIND